MTKNIIKEKHYLLLDNYTAEQIKYKSITNTKILQIYYCNVINGLQLPICLIYYLACHLHSFQIQTILKYITHSIPGTFKSIGVYFTFHGNGHRDRNQMIQKCKMFEQNTRG